MSNDEKTVVSADADVVQDKAVPTEHLPPIAQALLNRYAIVSGDPNPIHLDPEAARQAGLPGVIAHGMLVAGFASRRALQFMAEQFSVKGPAPRLLRFQTRFKGMVLLGDALTIGGSIRSRTDTAWVLDLQVRNPAGNVVVAAVAEFKIDGV